MKISNEGSVSLHLPDSRKEVFYNPEMELSRDISVAFLQVVGNRNFVVCDLLSGGGARAIRYAKETSAKKVFANDANEYAARYVKENAALNEAENRVSVSCMGANDFLSRHKNLFDFIDIDPFGSPVYFMEELAKSSKPDSYLALTATDCGALAGVFPKTCAERYGIKLDRTECYKEVGVRNLVGMAAAHFKPHSLFVRPLLSHATEHYFRVFLKISRIGKLNTKYFYHCGKCGYCTFKSVAKCKYCKSTASKLGPVWASSLYDKAVCLEIAEKLKQRFRKSAEARKLVFTILDECDQPFYYNIHKISERLSANTPGMKNIIRELKKRGHEATRTQFSNTSIKTDAGLDNIKEIIKTFGGQQPRKR
ncbi:MAG: tRNA (guanine(10)-N(2))-dimethyltransferase [Candidatus Aenigmarchaeota archaeon]|nr:tRNA (guanine(10)-N(2))-dimethyltransferase [Candidatus Aenigmarchaeota archaeon]